MYHSILKINSLLWAISFIWLIYKKKALGKRVVLLPSQIYEWRRTVELLIAQQTVYLSVVQCLKLKKYSSLKEYLVLFTIQLHIHRLLVAGETNFFLCKLCKCTKALHGVTPHLPKYRVHKMSLLFYFVFCVVYHSLVLRSVC